MSNTTLPGKIITGPAIPWGLRLHLTLILKPREMNNVRHNLFERTHKILSRMVFDAGMYIQQTDFSCPEQSRPVIIRMEDSINFYRYHIIYEDALIYNSIVHAAPYIVALIENANARDLRMTNTLNEKMNGYDSLCIKQSFESFGVEIREMYFSYTSAVLQHIHTENTVINDILFSHFSDKQLVDIEMKLVRQMFAPENNWYARHIMNWITRPEIISWINGISANGYSNEVEQLLTRTKPAVPEERWQVSSQNFSMQEA